MLQGAARELIDINEFSKLDKTGTVITDDRRRRPRYFDGRFLAARDLTREQTYFLTRQSDLGRAVGSGVVTGLMVSAGDSPSSIKITAGNGVTPAGEMVLVPNDLSIELADASLSEPLDVAFGISRIPSDLTRNRTGIFVVALRPIEYTANPVASYPVTINGPRSVQDGDIIEAVAVTLIPYNDGATASDLDARRSQLAARIFVDEGPIGAPENVLALAMIALDRGRVEWVDPFLVRREVGAEHGSVLGLGFSPRALREAQLLQYLRQLAEVLSLRSQHNSDQHFAASEYFEALPSAGMMPTATISPPASDDPAKAFTQIYFPSQMQVDMSVVPTDEVPALLDESFLLPPVDLRQNADGMQSTSILVLVPVPRSDFANVKAALVASTSAGTNPVLRPLAPAAPGLLSQFRPIDSLRSLTLLRLVQPAPTVDDAAVTAWRQALARSPLLWYVRRRNLQLREDVMGNPVSVTSSDSGTLSTTSATGTSPTPPTTSPTDSAPSPSPSTSGPTAPTAPTGLTVTTDTGGTTATTPGPPTGPTLGDIGLGKIITDVPNLIGPTVGDPVINPSTLLVATPITSVTRSPAVPASGVVSTTEEATPPSATSIAGKVVSPLGTTAKTVAKTATDTATTASSAAKTPARKPITARKTTKPATPTSDTEGKSR